MGELLVWNVEEMSFHIELNVAVPLLFWILVKGLTIHNSEIFIDGSLSNKAKQADLFLVLQKICFWMSFLGEPLPKGESMTGIKEGN